MFCIHSATTDITAVASTHQGWKANAPPNETHTPTQYIYTYYRMSCIILHSYTIIGMCCLCNTLSFIFQAARIQYPLYSRPPAGPIWALFGPFIYLGPVGPCHLFGPCWAHSFAGPCWAHSFIWTLSGPVRPNWATILQTVIQYMLLVKQMHAW